MLRRVGCDAQAGAAYLGAAVGSRTDREVHVIAVTLKQMSFE